MILLNKNEVKTMTSDERVAGLHTAIVDVYKIKIQGDFVECGVWMGGNLIIAKKFFDSVNDLSRVFYGFDTFEGMTKPTENDSKKAHRWWDGVGACIASIEDVITEIKKHEIFDHRVILVKGDVNNTLTTPANLPEKISILRLDTDWYDSTKIELEILYNKLVPGGYLIIDDYGYWSGCAKAVDEFFGKEFVNNNFQKLDNTGIMYKKN
jgi:hypothetical protein